METLFRVVKLLKEGVGERETTATTASNNRIHIERNNKKKISIDC